jgi:hypothetical protein
MNDMILLFSMNATLAQLNQLANIEKQLVFWYQYFAIQF